MYLSHLSLTNFRNFSRLELDLTAGITLLQGLNAQGKTSFLEAVAYLSTSRSLLAGAERELVHWLAWEEPLPFARLVGEMVVAGGRKQKIEITLVQSSKSNAGAPLLRKEVRVNGVSRRAIDLVGQMPTVLFLPQDVELISGSPSVRRRYLDIALCQMQPDYCRSLGSYNKVLDQRNALLKALRDQGGAREQLAFWDEQLVAQGSLLMARRAAFVAELEAEANQRQQALTDGRERLHVRYLPSLEPNGNGEDLAGGDAATLREPSPLYLAGDQASIVEAFQAALARTRQREVARGHVAAGSAPRRRAVHRPGPRPAHLRQPRPAAHGRAVGQAGRGGHHAPRAGRAAAAAAGRRDVRAGRQPARAAAGGAGRRAAGAGDHHRLGRLYPRVPQPGALFARGGGQDRRERA